MNVTLPDHVAARLRHVATEQHTTVENLLIAAIRPLVSATSRRGRILNLVTAGWSDRMISEHTGELRTYIGAVRRDAGLKPNKEKS